MKTFILLVFIHWGYGVAALAPEFESLAACEKARTDFITKWGSDVTQVSVCVARGDRS